jgi:dolichyl-phosphate-mannose-protein mannosyltransferase
MGLNQTEDAHLESLTPHRAERHARRRWYHRPVLVIAGVTAIAGGLRFYQLAYPHQFIFDEVYYAKDGCYDAGIPYRDCQLASPGEQTVTVHPPLGRWITAGGITLTGGTPQDFHCDPDHLDSPNACNPFAFRFASAVFGTLSVTLAAILAYRLFFSAIWAGVTGLLLATENLNFVQSRVAMFDIFLAAFVVAGFLFLVLDRQWVEHRTPPPPELSPAEREEARLLDLPPDRPPSPVIRPWRVAAGVAFGAATAVKWSGGTALIAAVVLSLAWERTRRVEVGLAHPWRETIRDESFGIVLFLGFLPVALYVASYVPWFAGHRWSISEWVSLQHGMASFSLTLHSPHPYASRPWQWWLMARPVAYYYACATKSATGGCLTSAEVLGMGSPAIFWGSLFAIPWTLIAWRRRRDWRAGLIFTAFALQYFPWFLTSRTSFLFYMTPITPFMVLAVSYALRDMSEVRVGESGHRPLVPFVILAVLVCVGTFVFFLPILTGRVIPDGQRVLRMWFPSWI